MSCVVPIGARWSKNAFGESPDFRPPFFPPFFGEILGITPGPDDADPTENEPIDFDIYMP